MARWWEQDGNGNVWRAIDGCLVLSPDAMAPYHGVWRVFCTPDRKSGGPLWCEECGGDLFPEVVLDDGWVCGYLYVHKNSKHITWTTRLDKIREQGQRIP
jgi:hypothetical protein